MEPQNCRQLIANMGARISLYCTNALKCWSCNCSHIEEKPVQKWIPGMGYCHNKYITYVTLALEFSGTKLLLKAGKMMTHIIQWQNSICLQSLGKEIRWLTNLRIYTKKPGKVCYWSWMLLAALNKTQERWIQERTSCKQGWRGKEITHEFQNFQNCKIQYFLMDIYKRYNWETPAINATYNWVSSSGPNLFIRAQE